MQMLNYRHVFKQTGMEAIEGLRFLASFGPPGTGKRKGGEKMQPFNRFHSQPGSCDSKHLDTAMNSNVTIRYVKTFYLKRKADT